MSHSSARRLLSGSALRVIALIASLLVSFYMMPFLVHALGDRWYGFWALAGTIVGYYAVLDLGLTPAAHRFLAMAHGRGDRRETSQVFTTALVLFTCGGVAALVITAITWLVAPWFIVPSDVAIIRPLILLLGTSFALGFPVAVFNGVLAANLRYDLSSYIQLARLLVRTALAVIAFQHVASVVSLAWITLATDLGANIVTVMCALRLWPWLEVSRQTFDRRRVREFFTYGLYSFLSRLGDLVRFGVDNLVVGAFLGVATVTHYAIAMRLTDAFQDLMVNTLGVLSPVFSAFHGANNKPAIYNLLRQASRLSVVLSATVAGAACIFGGLFIRRWMGPDYLDAYAPLVILVCATLVGVMQLPSWAYLFAIARHRYYAGLNGFDAAANFALSLFLAARFGMLGVALGTLIPALIVKLYLQPRYVCAQLGMPLRAYWRELGGVLLPTLLLQVPIAGIAWALKPKSYVGICGLAAVLYVIDAIVLFLFVLHPEDRSGLTRAFPPLGALVGARRRIGGVAPPEAS